MTGHRARRDRRRGFALLAVLWIVTGVAAIAMVATLAARDAVDAARNRTALGATRWLAVGCLERARASSDVVMKHRAGGAAGEGAWAVLDSVVLSANTECSIRIRAAGDAIDVNEVDGEALLRALAASRIDSARAVMLRDALLDWRDADTVTRPMGVERAWYVAAGRTPPRDGALVAHAELVLVRGWEDRALASAFDVEMGRVVIARAPLPVLASLPGMSPEAALQVLEARARGVRPVDVASLAWVLAPAERAAVTSRVPELSARVAPEPDAWIVGATATGAVPVTLEERWARSGSRIAVVRHGVVR